MNNNYLVYWNFDGEDCEPKIMTAPEVFHLADHPSDSVQINRIYLLTKETHYPIECVFRGIWHNFRDPLRMEIRKLTNDEVLAVGYGEDR